MVDVKQCVHVYKSYINAIYKDHSRTFSCYCGEIVSAAILHSIHLHTQSGDNHVPTCLHVSDRDCILVTLLDCDILTHSQ